MAGRKFSTWVEVSGTSRKEEPKFGSNGNMSLDIYVGYGASDSTKIATIEVRKMIAHKNLNVFKLYVDDYAVASVDATRRVWGIEDWLQEAE